MIGSIYQPRQGWYGVLSQGAYTEDKKPTCRSRALWMSCIHHWFWCYSACKVLSDSLFKQWQCSCWRGVPKPFSATSRKELWWWWWWCSCQMFGRVHEWKERGSGIRDQSLCAILLMYPSVISLLDPSQRYSTIEEEEACRLWPEKKWLLEKVKEDVVVVPKWKLWA